MIYLQTTEMTTVLFSPVGKELPSSKVMCVWRRFLWSGQYVTGKDEVIESGGEVL